MNIADILAERARGRADHPAIEDGARTVTYAELEAQVSESAANLQAVGIVAGDIVAVMLPDSADHLVVLCALARAGAVILSLNGASSPDELARSLTSMPVKAAITGVPVLPVADLRRLAVQEIRRPAPAPFVPPGVGGDDPVMLIQSSGTTGAPKSFVRSHADIGAWIGRYARAQGWNPADRCLSLTAMSFNVGRNISIGMLHVGATVVVNHARSLDELADAVREKRITYLKLTPSHLGPLIDYAAGKGLLFPGLRAMVVGSAPVTHQQRLLARERLTPNLMEQLGANEAGLLAFATPADQDAYPDAVGRVVEGVEAQIVDVDDRSLPAGEVGLVRYRGAGFPTAYLDDPEATARTFRDGWFYPGDLAALNDEGYLFFKGRADDVINSGGVKFYPSEVETALLAHPAVAEAAVFAWPHKRHGQIAAACVVTRAPLAPRDLAAFCAKRIAGYKVPQVILPLPEMPRNPMGKIMKSRLKDILRRELAQRRRHIGPG